ncbi:MAG: hypothetical protein J7M25_15880 [Deltaproteobacteria bacterium]|nr:hypothetical protein [Deltaproteobacteria bacterium]
MTYQLIICAVLLAPPSTTQPRTARTHEQQPTANRASARRARTAPGPAHRKTGATATSRRAPTVARATKHLHASKAATATTNSWAIVVASPHPTKRQVQQVVALYSHPNFRGLGQAVGPTALRMVLAGAPFNWTIAEARSTLAAARLSYATVKLQQAINQLRRVESLYLRYVPSPQAKNGLHQVWALMVLAYHTLGMSQKARKSAENLALLEPTGNPVPPAIWRQYAPKRPARSRRTLTVDAPANATLLMDFKAVQPTAHRADRATWSLKVSRGGHHIMLDAPGHAHFYAWVPPGRKDAQTTVDMPTRPADSFAELRAFFSSLSRKNAGLDPAALESIARRTRIRLLLVAWFDVQGLKIRAFDSRHKRYLGTTITLKGTTGQGTQTRAWTKQVALALSPVKARPSHVPLPRKALANSTKKAAGQEAKRAAEQRKLKGHHKRKPLWKRWYFWVAIGTVGILAGVFAYKNKDNSTSDVVRVRVHRP